MCAEPIAPAHDQDAILRTTDLRKTYGSRTVLGSSERCVVALDGVNLEIRRGTTLGLVGKSGCGKSTFARCVVRLEQPTSGQVWFEGQDLTSLSPADLRALRRKMQLVFQDPASAFHPGWPAWKIVAEPLRIAKETQRRQQRRRAHDLIEQVGLPRNAADKASGELSGGQKQRLAVARALALQPQLLILDEAFSSLDLSTQAQVANLLTDLQESHGLAYLFITHDLSLAGRFCDDIAVMAEGKIVEHGTSSGILRHCQHPETQALLAAVPTLEASPASEAP